MAPDEQKIINELQANWIWVPNWTDSSQENTAGKIVSFVRSLELSSLPMESILHFSADTRYKVYVNGKRLAVGPTRSSPLIWYYDTLDIAPYLKEGLNIIEFKVIRYFAALRAAMPFQRTSRPGLTVVGNIATDQEFVNLASSEHWVAYVDERTQFPMGLADDVFLHISERADDLAAPKGHHMKPVAYNTKTLNGDIPPWNLRPRSIPMPESTPALMETVKACDSSIHAIDWTAFFVEQRPLTLSADSKHTIEVQAQVHSTVFLRWEFRAASTSYVGLKVTYSEGYELEPRSYPFFRSKADRLDASSGHIIGPFDEVSLLLLKDESAVYEPFWFRTFRLLRVEITVGDEPVKLVSLDATQVNYPLNAKASWKQPEDLYAEKIWEVSIRTMRNCMFDGYSDCPFYEQLQYSGDTRSVGLFHYLLSGDDRLMRQAMTNFAASVTPSGLTQSRFPSHVSQVIAGFSLYWILQVCDHHLYFGDTLFARSFLPRIDGVLDFFHTHTDELGLVSRLPQEVWQYVDWVATWGATDEHPDKGVPTSGRKSNRHTYFSMLYAWVLQKVAGLVRDVGRPGHAAEYEARAESLLVAIRTHCYDGEFFTDSTSDLADELSYSQHCQVFAVICGAAKEEDSVRILTESFTNNRFSKCSYMMRFYAFRAIALAGNDLYDRFWDDMWAPWRGMLAKNLSTWEEDDVRQRSDCHAWGSVPIYEYCTELAGVQPISHGCSKISWRPRLRLTGELYAKVMLGKDNSANVSWYTTSCGRKSVNLSLAKPVEVVSRMPGGNEEEHGVVDQLFFICEGS
ncbi:Bacterial alpha-L-rhamnosidase [Penicillium argentinense]|uniref:Bacterial alpha-L-rhamnosidase n=1 Tax=Penicillium argentinense TaxID=1131581 RepID=A0A9W9EZF0_9EURO|nr:Bacterial alpha-L-rhamnosidase [Penicillium argentinense]KAJ5090787.1 Bacterial alpha-L-rhamnosidase [Penicillium argentinense]